jgi:phage repressor protein C with HTH and peptisase S24 domain
MSRLDVYMALKGITQADLRRALEAKGHSITPGMMSLIVAGKRGVKSEYVDIICDVLQEPRDELWSEEGTAELYDRLKKTSAPEQATAAAATAPPRALVPVHGHFDVDVHLRLLPKLAEPGDLADALSLLVAREGVAATQLDNLDAVDGERILVPRALSKIHGARAFAVRIVGESMLKAGIEPGDVLIVRRSSSAKDEEIVIAAQDGGVTCARLRGELLVKESDDKRRHPDIPLAEGARVLGVAKAIYKPPK